MAPLRRSDPATFARRKAFEPAPDLQILPLEKMRRPRKSRAELPPLRAGLQWIGMHPTLKADLCALLEAKVLAGKKTTGRTGLALGPILVLGVVRLGLDADGDRMEDLANHHTLLRQRLGVPAAPWGQAAKTFHHQTLRDNVALLDDQLLQQINARVAAAGREGFAKKAGAPGAALELKADTSVLATDVPFPTDLNLLLDAGRKCVDLVEKYRDPCGSARPGWRKAKDWRRRLKACARLARKTVDGGGKNKEARGPAAGRAYLSAGRDLSAKVRASLLGLCAPAVEAAPWEAWACFHALLDQHRDLVERRLLKEETIPAAEKVFSLFEPHPEWIQKGKQRPHVELGPRLLVATDQHELVQDDDVPVGGADVDQSVPVADRLLGRDGEGAIASLSFDQGFTRAEDRELLSLYVPAVVMPKRGKKNAVETARARAKKWGAMRRPHRAVESALNALAHHGLNRCLDLGLDGYRRYGGNGVLSCNLHGIGRELLARARAETVRAAA